MNLNIMLLVFVLVGFTIFKGTFEAEQNNTTNSTVLNTLTNLILHPTVNTTRIFTCSGFTDCTGAFFSAALDLLTSVFFIVADIIIFVFIIIAILIFPIPAAPLMIQLLFYTLEIGGIYVIVGMFRGGE